jgi:hypothetical protein
MTVEMVEKQYHTRSGPKIEMRIIFHWDKQALQNNFAKNLGQSTSKHRENSR